MLLITGARLGDRYGRRRTYLAGVIVFTTASLACALAPDGQALIAFRLAQGAGAAVLVPQVFSIIQLNFTGPARARALSAYAAVLASAANSVPSSRISATPARFLVRARFARNRSTIPVKCQLRTLAPAALCLAGMRADLRRIAARPGGKVP